ncbi:MAG: FAD-dependent oxidoreductase [Planctomycetes bacterium]|nr:FAD-dependent oxidoreductase [Planctomycetota bacterium]
MKSVAELKRKIPVCDEVDVLVCGGGPAGFCAALAAARAGAKTLLIEQMNCMGGIATAGGHNHLCLFSEWANKVRVIGGIAHEMCVKTVKMGYGVYDNASFDFELEGLKLALEQMAAEAGLNMLYHTLFADAMVKDGRIIGAYIQNKTGRQAVLAKMVVDATGDADVAASAGAPYEFGRPQDGACQPCTLMFTIGGVDWDRVCKWRVDKDGKHDYQMEHVWLEAQKNGDMEPFQRTIMGFWWTPTRPDQVGINFTHIFGVDCRRADHLTKATIEGRRQAFHMIPVFRKYVRGMENCYMISTASLLGTRESRRIVGEVVLTDKDILARKDWPDNICYGSFFIDVHNCTGPGMDGETYRPEPGFRYQIPYRCLVPRQVENLLVAGRCISVTHRALGSTRVMPQCAAMGEAAGAAAALSIKNSCSPRTLDTAKLQDYLRSTGNIIDEDGIKKANA